MKKRSDSDAVYIGEFREKGYLPEALFNFLSLLGWSPKDEREIMSREEIISLFDISDVNKSSAVFDIEKLNWMNGKYIREADLEPDPAVIHSLFAGGRIHWGRAFQ